MNHTQGFAALVTLVFGYVIWSFALVFLYAGHANICAGADAWRSAANLRSALWLPGLFWVVHIMASGGFALWSWRSYRVFEAQEPPRRFLHGVTVSLALSAFIATVMIGLPMLLVSPCV